MKPEVIVALAEGADLPAGIELLGEVCTPRYVRSANEFLAARERSNILFVWDLQSPLVRECGPGNLEWIHTNSIGVNAVATPAVTEAGILVTNTRGVFERPMAEFVLASILAHAQNLGGLYKLQSERRWERRRVGLIRDRHVVVVGAGGVGVAIARLLRQNDMRVSIVGRSRRFDEREVDGQPLGLVHGLDELTELLGDADDVVLAAPLTQATRNLFGASEFRSMQTTGHLINVGRGELIDETALVDALEQGEISHASLDVFHVEPLPPAHRLWTLPNVTVSPHHSAVYSTWQEDVTKIFIENLDRWMQQKPLINRVKLADFIATEN